MKLLGIHQFFKRILKLFWLGKVRECPETCRIGTPFNFQLWGGAKLKNFIYVVGAKLEKMIYGRGAKIRREGTRHFSGRRRRPGKFLGIF